MVTKGGITVKVLTGRAAAPLQRYRDDNEDGQEQYLYSATRHCSHDVRTQISEWKDVREEHKTQGARRAARATHETVDPETGLHASGERGTHVKFYDGKRWRKRPVRAGEMPTHLRIEPGSLTSVKESEATHTIYAFGADMVNADNPEETQRAFDAVVAHRAEQYPGLQESMWGERNGESGLFHVHVASNATIYEGFTLDGVDYRAGQKMAGDLTKVDSVRGRFEQYLDAHPEHQMEQSLARVGSAEYEAAQLRDGQATYREAKRGKKTAQEKIREASKESLCAQGVDDRDDYVAAMKTRGVTVTETGLRRGKRSSNHDYLYRVKGGKKTVKGATLGPNYSYDAVGQHLDDKAKGKTFSLSAPAVRQPRLLPFEQKPLSAEEVAALAQLRADVDQLAEAQRARQQAAAEVAAAAEPEVDKGLSVEDDDRLAQEEPVVDEPQQLGVDAPAEDERMVEAEAQEADGPAAAAPAAKPQRRRFVSSAPVHEPTAEVPSAQQQPKKLAEPAEAVQEAPAEPRQEQGLMRFSPGRRHFLLVVDDGRVSRGGERALDVQLDSRDAAAAGQQGLHLGRRGSRVWYSAADVERIKDAAGDNVHRDVGEDGRELRVYGVRGVVKPASRGQGDLVVQAKTYDRSPLTGTTERNALTRGYAVGESWLGRQRESEDRARLDSGSRRGSRGESSVIDRAHVRAKERPQRSIAD